MLLRPLRADDWDAWREVRLRCREWLERWEPVPEPGSADPALDREAFRARCAAWDRQRHFDAAYGFGLFLLDGRFAGEVSLGSVQRGPFQMGYVGYWIDEALAGNDYVPEGVVLIMRYAFEALQLHRLEAAIVPRNAASRRVAEKLGLRDEGTARAVPADPRRLRGPHPLRDHRRGVARARARARRASSSTAEHAAHGVLSVGRR